MIMEEKKVNMLGIISGVIIVAITVYLFLYL